MYQPLVPCESCRRHVRAVDASCPFCRHSRTPDTSAAPGQVLRMSRAAALVFMTTVAGCHSDPANPAIAPDPVATGKPAPKPEPTPEPIAPPDAGLVDDPGAPAAKYGAPPLPKPPKPTPTGIAVPAYGVPPPPMAPPPPPSPAPKKP